MQKIVNVNLQFGDDKVNTFLDMGYEIASEKNGIYMLESRESNG